eukprot:scaffold28510_cov16-Tisochrysis_lutea.AAC.1
MVGASTGLEYCCICHPTQVCPPSLSMWMCAQMGGSSWWMPALAWPMCPTSTAGRCQHNLRSSMGWQHQCSTSDRPACAECSSSRCEWREFIPSTAAGWLGKEDVAALQGLVACLPGAANLVIS